MAAGSVHLERVDRHGANGVMDRVLVRLLAEGMDSGLYDLVMELGAAIEASNRAEGEGSSIGGARCCGRWGECGGFGISLRRGVSRADCLASEGGGA